MTNNKNKTVKEEKQSQTSAPRHDVIAEEITPTATNLSRPPPPAMYQQFTPAIVTVLVSMVVLLILIAALFYQKEVATLNLVDNQLTPLKNGYQTQQLLRNSDLLLETMLSKRNSAQIIENQQSLITTQQKLRQFDLKNQLIYKNIIDINKSFQNDVSRIQRNSESNQQLKQSNVIQLQLIIFSLDPIIKQKTTQAMLLAKQLKQDNINDRVKVNRALAYAKTLEQLQFLAQLKQSFSNILVRFEQLSIQTPLVKFELMRNEITQVFELNEAKNTIKNNAMNEVNGQITIFERLVLTDERTLAKWQGHLRVAEKFIISLKEQRSSIEQIIIQQKDVKVNNSSAIDVFLSANNISLTAEKLWLITLSLILFVLAIIIYLLWQLRIKIKNYSQNSVEIINKYLLHSEGEITANGMETLQILEKIQEIKQPKHSQEDFSQLQEKYLLQISKLDKSERHSKKIDKDNAANILKATKLLEQHHREQVINNDLLSTMLVKAMLQSQSHSLLAGHTVHQGYRQLKRIYDWTQQQHIQRCLLTETSVLQLDDINLHNEVHAAILNIASIAQQQQNQVNLQYDPQIASLVKLDAQLFQQLITSFCSIMIAEQFKVQLQLKLAVKEVSEGQQIIHVSAAVTPHLLDSDLKSQDENAQISKSISLPESLLSLLESSVDISVNSSTQPENIHYFNHLLTKQFGNELVVQRIKQGYQLSFDLPLALVTTEQPIATVEDLTALNILAITGKNSTQVDLKSYLNLAGCKVNLLVEVDNVIQQLNSKKLNENKVDLVVLSSDVAVINHDIIQQYISSLPIPIQPKLMVLQSAQLPINRFGFYQQSQSPLFRQQFLSSIQTLVSSDAKNNQMATAKQCQGFQYVTTQVELLLAVQSPAQHQSLIRLLQWLGVQVLVVANSHLQEQQWQTGRFLLLISEFEQSPFVSLSTGTSLQRGVFSLTSKWQMPKISSENSAVVNSFKNWHCQQLPKLSDITQLTKLLAPWLKEKELETELLSKIKTVNRNLANQEAEAKVKSTLANPNAVNVIDISRGATTENTKIITTNDNATNIVEAFDLNRYVKHQGTPELAIFMLDEYLFSNSEAYAALCSSLESEAYQQASDALEVLLKNAKILAADKMVILCQTLQEFIADGKYPQAKRMLVKTTQQLSAIESYAESI